MLVSFDFMTPFKLKTFLLPVFPVTASNRLCCHFYS